MYAYFAKKHTCLIKTYNNIKTRKSKNKKKSTVATLHGILGFGRGGELIVLNLKVINVFKKNRV